MSIPTVALVIVTSALVQALEAARDNFFQAPISVLIIFVGAVAAWMIAVFLAGHSAETSKAKYILMGSIGPAYSGVLISLVQAI